MSKYIKEGVVTPVGAVTPDYKGQHYVDESQSPNEIFVAIGLTSNDWLEIEASGGGGPPAEMMVYKGVLDLAGGDVLPTALGASPLDTYSILTSGGDGFGNPVRAGSLLIRNNGFAGTISDWDVIGGETPAGATDTTAGAIEIATEAEALAGVAVNLAITPDTLSSALERKTLVTNTAGSFTITASEMSSVDKVVVDITEAFPMASEKDVLFTTPSGGACQFELELIMKDYTTHNTIVNLTTTGMADHMYVDAQTNTILSGDNVSRTVSAVDKIIRMQVSVSEFTIAGATVKYLTITDATEIITGAISGA